MHQIGYGADDMIKTHTTGANEFTSCSHEIHRMIRRQHKSHEWKELIPVWFVHTITPLKMQGLFSILAYFRAKNRLPIVC